MENIILGSFLDVSRLQLKIRVTYRDDCQVPADRDIWWSRQVARACGGTKGPDDEVNSVGNGPINNRKG